MSIINKLGLQFIGIGKHTPQEKDRTAILERDRVNLKCAVKQIKQLEFIDTSIDQNEWSDDQVLNQLKDTRKIIGKSTEYDGYISFIISHGTNVGNGINKIFTSDNNSIAYDSIKHFFRNDKDISQAAKYKPRLVFFYSCLGPSTTMITDDINSNKDKILEIHGNALSVTSNTLDNNLPSGIRVSVDSFHFHPFTNVIFVEAASLYHSITSFQQGTAAVMALVNYLRNNINKEITFLQMADEVVRQISQLHRSVHSRSIDPTFEPHQSTQSHRIRLEYGPYPPSQEEKALILASAKTIKKAGDELNARRDAANKTAEFMQNKLSLYVPNCAHRYIFQQLSQYKRYVTFDKFTQHFINRLSNEQNVNEITKNILNKKLLQHLISDIIYEWSDDIDDDDFDYASAEETVDVVIFHKIYMIYDALVELLNDKCIRKLVQTEQLFYLPETLDSIHDHIDSINDPNKAISNTEYLKAITQFMESCKINESMLLLVPVEGDKFCGLIRITKFGSKHLTLDTLLSAVIQSDFNLLSAGTQTNQPLKLLNDIIVLSHSASINSQTLVNICSQLSNNSIIDIHRKNISKFIANSKLVSYDSFVTQIVLKKYKLKHDVIDDCKLLISNPQYEFIKSYIDKGMVSCVWNQTKQQTKSLGVVKEFQKYVTSTDKSVNKSTNKSSDKPHILLIINICKNNDELEMKCIKWQHSTGNFIVKEYNITKQSWLDQTLSAISSNSNVYIWVKNKSIEYKISDLVQCKTDIDPIDPINSNNINNNNVKQVPFSSDFSGVTSINETFNNINFNINQKDSGQQIKNRSNRNRGRLRRIQRNKKRSEDKNEMNDINMVDLSINTDTDDTKMDCDNDNVRCSGNICIKKNRKRGFDDMLKECKDDNNNICPDAKKRKLNIDTRKLWMIDIGLINKFNIKSKHSKYHDFIFNALGSFESVREKLYTLYKEDKMSDAAIRERFGYYLVAQAMEKSTDATLQKFKEHTWNADYLDTLPDWEKSYKVEKGTIKFRFQASWQSRSIKKKIHCGSFVQFCRKVAVHFHLFYCGFCLKKWKYIEDVRICDHQ